ncbi:hypothetical protein [Aliiroseovarius halocynthiae]|uniref:Uncharacterized protein n=1 Tax=Aliiroseovarius halocynthiae TaxID=985055 RepID=A0A545SWM2_9RHOB|nr:hypothetical protein [Aliiroseovarius halocynthiae]TQV69361.1 hypothetical protein FIL88_07380 [Aliiroseovarius halocynthiae]
MKNLKTPDRLFSLHPPRDEDAFYEELGGPGPRAIFIVVEWIYDFGQTIWRSISLRFGRRT